MPPQEAQHFDKENDEDGWEDRSVSDEGSSANESIERELLDKLSDQKQLDARFSQKQLAYLNERKDAYRYAPANQRRELAQATGDYFLKQMQQAGRDPSKDQVSAMYQNVKLWYGQRARSRHGPMHWTIQWNGRKVYYKENSERVLETQRKLFEIETGTKCPESPGGVVDLDLVGEDAPTLDPGKQPKLFHFFQRAVTAEWMALSDEERAAYESKALLWREKGPTPDERRRLAEKESGRVIHQFADEIYRQMGVRLHFLVSFEDTTGEHVAFSLDFNNQIDGGVSFKQAERAYLEKVDLENYWAGFVRRTLPEPKSDETDGATKRPRKRGEPIPVELNQFSEPIVPSIDKLPSTVKAYRYLPDLIRSIMRHDYACARGLAVGDPSTSPPWKEMALNWRKWIDEEFWPEEWPVGDPAGYRVENCRAILQFWSDRQERGDIPFQFRSYWLGGDVWLPRKPRQEVGAESEEIVVPKKKGRRSKKKETEKSKRKLSKKEDKPQKPRATSTARQSASVAMKTGRRAPQDAVEPPAPSAGTAPEALSLTSHNPRTSSTDERPREKVNRKTARRVIDSDSDGDASYDESEWGREDRPHADTLATDELVGAANKLSLKVESREGSAMEIDPSISALGVEKGEPIESPAEELQRQKRNDIRRRNLLKVRAKANQKAVAEDTVSFEGAKDDRAGGIATDHQGDGSRSAGEEPPLESASLRGGRKGRGGRGARERGGTISSAIIGDGSNDMGDPVIGSVKETGGGASKPSTHDQRLLEAAAPHLPTSTKRSVKKVVRFGEEAPDPKARSRGSRK